MTDPTPIRFDDGAGYERMMGTWSRIAGGVFLDWLQPAPGLRWVDVGCGNGAFTELLVDRCAPKSVHGIDPSDAQLEFARQRPAARLARFAKGGAEALPFEHGQFDAAAMALVIFFVPDPAQGVREMARVLRPGGGACAYAWDILEGGFPLEPLLAEMRAEGQPPNLPPSAGAERLDSLQKLWTEAGFVDVHTTQFSVQRTFESFDELWEIAMLGTSIRQKMASLPDEVRHRLKERLRSRQAPDAAGRITWNARANAVKGRLKG
ncbi:MAG: methyltransferase domain-containing protein [Burkholderiales bacterium]|nr:methyltransferase domain-containing protein [Burkholderiales bacterium]